VHLALVTIIMAALYLHMSSRVITEPPTVYLLAAICLQGFIGLIRFIYILYRNVRHRKTLNRAFIQPVSYRLPNGSSSIPVSDIVHMHVKLSRPWKPRAGQWFYICIPGVSHMAFIQSHPLYVSWWYHVDNPDHVKHKDKKDRICDYNCPGDDYVVFLVQKQRGFSRNLFLHTGNSFDDSSTMRAIIEGPYGNELRLDSYGTVILFATGIGIAGQLPYIAQLLKGYRECKVKTRKIEVFWEVESECESSYVYTCANQFDRSYRMGCR
jgi:predicted ferric reductase